MKIPNSFPVAIRSRGFSLVSAIFLLVVLAGLGVAMVTISTSQHQSAALDVQGVRAYQTAKAGIEWGLYRYLVGHANCDPSFTRSFTPDGSSFTGFTVTVSCTSDGTLPIANAVIRSTACNIQAGGCPPASVPNSSDYVQRTVEVRL